MSTGATKDKQHRSSQEGGGQMVGNPKAVDRARVSNFQGKSGQGDNQSTNRGPGRT